MNKCPGIDISTGSLGQGLACGVGMALAAKMDKKDYRVYVAVGDGEAQEGEIWEAANTAHKYGLDNLVVFVDFNNLQIDGTCDEVMPNGDLGQKFRDFGFDAYEIDGNDMEQMVAALTLARTVKNGKPKCIYGHTVKGKGISARVVDMHTIKPLDVACVTDCLENIGKVITVEDHNIMNGLGSAVCEVAAELGKGKVKRVGIQDQFGESAPYERLLARNGITVEDIMKIAEGL